jgi:hypothetical protein
MGRPADKVVQIFRKGDLLFFDPPLDGLGKGLEACWVQNDAVIVRPKSSTSLIVLLFFQLEPAAKSFIFRVEQLIDSIYGVLLGIGNDYGSLMSVEKKRVLVALEIEGF